MSKKIKNSLSGISVKVGTAVFLLVLQIFFNPSLVSAKVVINELLPNPASGHDWLEIYADLDTVISGWIITDEAKSSISVLPEGTMIGPSSGRFFMIDCGTRLNKTSDTVYLRNADGKIVDMYSYSTLLESEWSFGRYPDGGDWMKCVPSYDGENNGCNQLTEGPTREVEPALINKISNAMLMVNDVVDNNGEILTNVKIYLDGNYIHHYVPETIEFCDDCNCGGYANCGFGSHELMLEKAGYNVFTQNFTLHSGETVDINPVFKVKIVATDTPAPTIKFTPTPIPPIVKVTPLVSSSSASKINSFVLGVEDQKDEPVTQTKNEDSSDKQDTTGNRSLLPALLMASGGLSFLLAAAYPLISKNGLKLGRWLTFPKNEGEN